MYLYFSLISMWNIENGNCTIERITTPTDHYSDETIYYSYYTNQNALRSNSLYWFNERAELKKRISIILKLN